MRGGGAWTTGTEGGAGAAAGGATGLGGCGGATTGFATIVGGAGGRTGGAATASFFWVIALSTSPGREMCDKSILVLISSSWSSSELEWVFFSVTPTSGSASRMALLLTSSSLARSLIRTLLIRPFFSPR